MKTVNLRFAIVVFLLLTVLSFWFAAYGYPLFTGDSGCFMPAGYFLNAGKGLINPLYDAGIDTAQHRMLFYPPVFPYVVNLLLKISPKSGNAFFYILTFFEVAANATVLYSLYCYARQRGIAVGRLGSVFIVIWVVAMFGFHSVFKGRPETLIHLFIAIFLLNNVNPYKFKHLINGGIVALCAFTSPISSFYLAVICGFILFQTYQFTFKNIALSLAGAVVVALAFIVIYPYQLSELLRGMSKHSQNVIFNRLGSGYLQNFISRYITSADIPLGIVPFIICFIYVLLKVLSRQLYLAALTIVLLAILVSYFSFKDMAMTYNMMVLAPFVWFLLPLAFFDSCRIAGQRFTPVMQVCFILVLLCNGIGFIRKTILLAAVQKNYVAPANFQHKFTALAASVPDGKKVIVSCSLWPYALNNANQVLLYRTFDPNDPVLKDPSARYLMVQQNYTGLAIPPEYAGYRLIEHNFINERPKLLGINVGNTFPGYQVAIYEKR